MRILAFALSLVLGCGSTVGIERQGDGGSGGDVSSSGGTGGGLPCEAPLSCCDDSTGKPADWTCVDGQPVCPSGASWAGPDGCQGSTGCLSPNDCGPTEFCDFPDDLCGDGQPGTCLPRPQACDDDYAPRCTCNGEIASNQCGGQSNGFDIDGNGGCVPPPDTFACGAMFCAAETEYCLRSVSDVAGLPDEYQCKPYPTGCGGAPSCGCLANEPCGEFCDQLDSGDFMLTCPAG